MDLASQLTNLAFDMISKRTKLPPPGLDRLLHWDIDRSGRGCPEVPNSLSDLLELRRCVALERNSYVKLTKFIKDTFNTIRDIVGHCLARNWQAVDCLRIRVVHDQKRFVESWDCRAMRACIL